MRVGIVGTGLIGASIGLGLRRAGHHVTGWDPDRSVLERAVDEGALDEASGDLGELVGSSPQVLFVAAPFAATVDLLATIDHEGLIVDVTGVKGPVVAAGRRLSRFVATHPMAGRETTGPEAASGALFSGAAWIVVEDVGSAEDRAVVADLIGDLGATPVPMRAADHDAAVARISQLPQILAASLVTLAAEDDTALDLAAGSFRDLTRVAASDPHAWLELLAANRRELGAAVDRLMDLLDETRVALGSGRLEGLEDRLVEARRIRQAMAPPVVPVRIAIADRPGELAKVGRALAASGVDVRDLQLRHATYGGGGILTISVRPGEAGTLVQALVGEGLMLTEDDRAT